MRRRGPDGQRPAKGKSYARWQKCTNTPDELDICYELYSTVSLVFCFTSAPSHFFFFTARRSLAIQSMHRRDGAALDAYVGHPGPLHAKIKGRCSPTCERKPPGEDTGAETSQRARTTTGGSLQGRRCRSGEQQHGRDKTRNGRVPATHHGTGRREEVIGGGSGQAGHVRAMSAAEHGNGTAAPRDALRR